MTPFVALMSLISSSTLFLGPIATVIITGTSLWSHVPRQTTRYFDRTYAASKEEESAFGVAPR